MTKIPVFAGQGLGSRAADAFITGDSTEATLPEKSTKGFLFFFGEESQSRFSQPLPQYQHLCSLPIN